MSGESSSVYSTKIRQRISDRFFRALDYISIFAFIFLVYGTAVFFDYLLFGLLWRLLSDDVNKYPIVALGFDYARIGLALLFIAGAIVHGIISTISQIQLDIKLAQEGEETK
jgi:hypothetical protein